MLEPPEGMRVGRFGPFEVNLTTGELRKHGIRLKLQDQPFEILVLLLARPGKLVSRDEIRQRLWPSGTFVDFDNGLNTALSRLREALGDSAESPRYIETLARRGYRWMVPVDWMASRSADLPAAVSIMAPSEAAPSDKMIGKKVSNYRILELLGAGGMGVVYKAEDLKLGRCVALKFLPQDLVKSPSALDRFEREARSASALNHPHICTIYEFEEYEGQPFLVMELLDGETLRERIGNASAPLQTNELVNLAIQITDGLEAAHQKGIIHRDIKPANIFLTNRGEAKILDFGLAKIVEVDEQPHNSLGQEVDETSRPRGATTVLSFEHTLTHTGAMIGSVSYMSPEQVRGEKLDRRTDLFSFGLVMYEMATGQRAFTGVTAIEVNEAILQRTPAPAHDWNAELPPKLQEIIDKALQKDRALRYQRAAEICADLKDLKSEMDSGRRAPSSRLLWKLAAAGFFVLLVTSAVMWLKSRQSSSPPEPILRQLTANSSENPIGPSAISPDGRYLAFTDGTHRMRVKIIATDETLTIPEPETLKGSAVRWNIAAWFPDGTRYLANARPPNSDPNNPTAQGTSIWTVSLGGMPRKLRDDSEVFSVSPDGSWIAFGTSASELGDREIWLMDPGGQQARKLYDTDGETALGGAVWSPDGQRLIYFRFDKSSGSFLSRDIKGGPPTTVLPFSDPTSLVDYVWLPDGRLIYSLSSEESGASGDNFWELRVDRHTGKPEGKPRRLTNWNGSHVFGMSVTADGKRIAFTKGTWQGRVDLAVIQANGARITLPTRLTPSEYINEAECWTPDGKAVIFESVRNGHRRLFRQALDSSIEEPIFAGAGDVNTNSCSVSPDGSWLFYNLEPKQLMRIPITGGTSQLVLKYHPSTTRQGGWMPRCSVSPAKLCVIAEQSEDGKPIIFTAFDAIKGRGQELTRIETEPGANYNIALSPDGTRIAVLKIKAGDLRILTLYLNGRAPREVRVQGWGNLQRLYWTADGKGWFTSGNSGAGWVLLHVDLEGNVDRLWEEKGIGYAFILPSPDGHHVAINAYTIGRNVWAMEGF